MKKYRVREKSLMWHLLRAKKPLQIIGMSIAFLLIFTAMSATAADDLQTYELQRGQAQSEEDVKPAEKVAVNGDMTPETAAEWTSLGEFKLTAYCPCSTCCGVWAENRPNGIVYTASGAVAEAGKTIAVDPDVIPYGTEVKIDGHTYIAEDTGGAIKGNKIDVYFDKHEEALKHGVKYAEVFVKEGDL